MQKITLKKTGIFFSFWDELVQQWVDRNITESGLPLSRYLPYVVQVDDVITLRDLLNHLAPFRNQIQEIFSSALSGITCEQMQQVIDSTKTDTNVPMNVLYLFKIGELSTIPDDELKLVSTYSVLMGLNTDAVLEKEDVYHLSSYSVIDWIDLPLMIDDFIEYIDVDTQQAILTGVLDFHLYEIIFTILSQIALTLQVKNAVSSMETKQLTSGPMTVDELFAWFGELDRILLSK